VRSTLTHTHTFTLIIQAKLKLNISKFFSDFKKRKSGNVKHKSDKNVIYYFYVFIRFSLERGDNETSLSIVKKNIDGVLEFLKINREEDVGKIPLQNIAVWSFKSPHGKSISENCITSYLYFQIFLHVSRILQIRHRNYRRFFAGYCRTRNSVFGKVVSLFRMVPKEDQEDFFLAAHLPSSSSCAKPLKVMSSFRNDD
jgi:hypothetical protein